MPGTAFDGSPWVTGLEIIGLFGAIYGATAGAAIFVYRGMERRWLKEYEESLTAELTETGPKRRRFAANTSLEAKESLNAEEMVVPNVVSDKKDAD